MDSNDVEDTKFKRRRHRRSDLSITYHCAVCGDKTNCYNFGVPACEGCKGFYRRHMTRIGSMVCPKDGNCEVTVETRKVCLACRMRKCCEVGMHRDPLTKDPVTKPRRSRTKLPGERQRRGRKPGTKLRPKVPEVAGQKNKAPQEKVRSTKQTVTSNTTKQTKATGGDIAAVAGECNKLSASFKANSLKTGEPHTSIVVRRLVSSAQLEESNSRVGNEQRSTDNGTLSYAYLLANPSSDNTFMVDSPRSVSSVPPKKRKQVVDSQECSPYPSRNDNGVWGNSFTQFNTQSDTDSNQPCVYDSSCFSANDRCLPVDSNCSIGHKASSYYAQQDALSCSDPSRSVAECGSWYENQRSALHHSHQPTVERPEDLASCLVHDLDADSLYELPDAVYQQIMSDCTNMATTMSAPWSRDELGATLYDDPQIPDGRYQLRYMESRLHRLVFSLKRSRCFSSLTDAEKLVLMKASMSNVFLPIVSHTVPNTGASVIERMDDGRIHERLCSDAVDVYSQYGLDLRLMFQLTRSYHVSVVNSPLAPDLPVLFSIFLIIMILQVSVEKIDLTILLPSKAANQLPTDKKVDQEERSRIIKLVRDGLERKLAAIRREHAAFLRRLVYERVGSAKVNEMWRFCVARLEDLTRVGELGRIVTIDFFKFGPDMLDTILPVIDEVMAPIIEVVKV